MQRLPSARVRVVKSFECARVLGAPLQQIIVYPAGWVGRIPGHHLTAGEAQGAVVRL